MRVPHSELFSSHVGWGHQCSELISLQLVASFLTLCLPRSQLAAMGKCELPFSEETGAPARPLSPSVLEKARVDLNEDEQGRERALAELRAWIGRNRRILTCREGQSEGRRGRGVESRKVRKGNVLCEIY